MVDARIRVLELTSGRLCGGDDTRGRGENMYEYVQYSYLL